MPKQVFSETLVLAFTPVLCFASSEAHHQSGAFFRIFPRSLIVLVLAVLLEGCVLTPTEAHHSATGIVTGRVVDASGQPVARAKVAAVYKRGWTWIAVPNALVVSTTYTDAAGQFRIVTRKRVDALAASSLRPYRVGHLDDVAADGNVVRVNP